MSEDEPTAETAEISNLTPVEDRAGIRALVNLRDPARLGDSVSVKPLEEGTTVIPRETGKYTVQGEIASGGVGVVLKAFDEEIGRDVAIKFLHKPLRGNQGLVNRFIGEAQIGGQLQHPGVIPVYDMGLAEGTPFFTMKLVKGRTLAKLLEERKDPSHQRRRFLSIFHRVCETMAYAHARGVIHRDLKPANIMIGAFGEVLVVDWGMGKVLKDSGNAVEETIPDRSEFDQTIIHTLRDTEGGNESLVGSILGTPRYMPPEQAMGDVEEMDERSDVFSLGAILTELLTGKPPYDAPRAELLPMVARAKLDPARERLRACGADPELIELAEDCLIPAPAARPRHAGIVAERVGKWLSAADEQIQQAHYKAASAKKTRNVAFAVGVLVLAAFAASLLFWQRAEQDRDKAESATQLARAAEAQAGEARDEARAARESAVKDRDAAERSRDDAGAARARAEKSRDAASAARARAEDESRKAGAVTRFIAGMLALADPLVSGSADPTLRTLLDLASARVGEDLAGDEEAQARIRTTMGKAYLSLGDMERAGAQLRQAVDLHYRAETRDLGQLYESVRGVYLVTRGGFGEDEKEWMERYEVLLPQVLAVCDPELAGEVRDLLLEVKSNAPLEKAAILIEQIAEYEFPSSDPESRAGRLRVRDVLIQAATRILDKSNPRQGGWTLSRRRALAQTCWAHAMDICHAVLPQGHPETISAAEALSRVLEDRGKHAEAAKVARQAADEIRDSISKDHWRVARLEAWLATLYLAQKGRRAEAEQLLLKSHARLVQHFRGETRETHEILQHLTGLYRDDGREKELEETRQRLIDYAITSPDSDLWVRVAPYLPKELKPIEDARLALLRCEGLELTATQRADAAMEKALDLLDERDRVLPDKKSPYAAVLARWMVWAADNHKAWLNRKTRQELTADAMTVLKHWKDRAPLALAYLWLERSAELSRPNEIGMREGALVKTYRLYRKHLDGDDEEDKRWHTLIARARLGVLRKEQSRLKEAVDLLAGATEGLLAIEGEDTLWNATRFREDLIELYLDTNDVENARIHALRHARTSLTIRVDLALRMLKVDAPEVQAALYAFALALKAKQTADLPSRWQEVDKLQAEKIADDEDLLVLYADALDGLKPFAVNVPAEVVLPFYRSVYVLRKKLHQTRHGKVAAAHGVLELGLMRHGAQMIAEKRFEAAEKAFREAYDNHVEREQSPLGTAPLAAALLDLHLAWNQPEKASAFFDPVLQFPLHASGDAVRAIAHRKGLEPALYERALEVIEAAHETAPWTERDAYFAARLAYWLGRYHDGIKHLTRSEVTWSDAGNRMVLILRALSHKRLDQQTEALAYHGKWKTAMGFRRSVDKPINSEIEQLFP